MSKCIAENTGSLLFIAAELFGLAILVVVVLIDIIIAIIAPNSKWARNAAKEWMRAAR